eukprot:TRINITY_DN4751_c0_g1_i1.p1 TRINITY_DN4751_c0_g1~~TRINITY_DN4751_c0_g1_i1.p1  ORF type:complete len:1187 (-),score=398.74 TRINITY_DN4751_c0_g1_i1:15-3524(-)
MNGEIIEETNRPLPRSFHSSNYWEKKDSIIVLGGKHKNETFCKNRLWISKANDYDMKWVEIELSPNSKETPTLCMHSSIIITIPNLSEVLFVFGGMMNNNQVINIGHMFNLTTNTWTTPRMKGEIPDARCGASLIQINSETLVLFGGMGSSGVDCLNEVFILDITKMFWTKQTTTGTSPIARYLHCCCLNKGKMWIFGGSSLSKNKYLTDIHCLDIATWKWSQPRQVGKKLPSEAFIQMSCTPIFEDALFLYGEEVAESDKKTFYVLDVCKDSSVKWNVGLFSGKIPTCHFGFNIVNTTKYLHLIGGRASNKETESSKNDKTTEMDTFTVDLEMFVQVKRKSTVSEDTRKSSTLRSDTVSGNDGFKQENVEKLKFAVSKLAKRNSELQTLNTDLQKLLNLESTKKIQIKHQLEDTKDLENKTKENEQIIEKNENQINSLKEDVTNYKNELSMSEKNLEIEMGSRINAEKESLHFKQLYQGTKEKLEKMMLEVRNLYKLSTSTENNLSQDTKQKLDKSFSDIEEIFNGEVAVNTQNININEKKTQNIFSKFKTKKDSLSIHKTLVEKINLLNGRSITIQNDKNNNPNFITLNSSTSRETSPVTLNDKKPGTMYVTSNNSKIEKKSNSSLNLLATSQKDVVKSEKKEIDLLNPNKSDTIKNDNNKNDNKNNNNKNDKNDINTINNNNKIEINNENKTNLNNNNKNETNINKSFLKNESNNNNNSNENIQVDLGNVKPKSTPPVRVAPSSPVKSPLLPNKTSSTNHKNTETQRRDTNLPIKKTHSDSIRFRPGSRASDSLIPILQERVVSELISTFEGKKSLFVETVKEQVQEAEKELEKITRSSTRGVQLFARVEQELIDTEKVFVEDVRIIVSLFRTPLLTVLSPHEIFQIFANIEEIYKLNLHFLTLLEIEKQKPLEEKNYGKIFLSVSEKFSKIFLAYCARQSTGRTTIDELVQTNKKFVNFLNEVAKNTSLRSLSMKSFLIKPVQRICKYPLLIKAMIENLNTEPAKELLSKSLKEMEETVNKIDNQLFIEDNKMRILEIESTLNWHRDPLVKLAVNNRRVAMSNILLVTQKKDKDKYTTPKKRGVYLMTDMILITSKKKFENLIYVFPIEFCVLLDVPNKPSFQIFDSDTKRLIFYCETLQEKESWVKKLHKLISHARNEIVLSNK